VTLPLILDTGALIGLARRDNRVWSLLDQAQRRGAEVLVPAATLAECLRGGPRDAPVNQLRTQVTVHDEERARSAGSLLRRVRASGAIHALLVAEAARYEAAVIATSDPRDIAALAEGYDVTIVEV
jgi:predicted nucleic acid-binding protein